MKKKFRDDLLNMKLKWNERFIAWKIANLKKNVHRKESENFKSQQGQIQERIKVKAKKKIYLIAFDFTSL